MDKEYIILQNIKKQENISQRELSKKTGLSLGSVNILLRKMVKEGLIKVEKIPAGRIAYILTPKGMLEKMNKTYNFIKLHYNFIDKTKEKIKKVLDGLSGEQEVRVMVEADELGEIIISAIKEMKNDKIKYIYEANKIDNTTIVTYKEESYRKHQSQGNCVLNLMEYI